MSFRIIPPSRLKKKKKTANGKEVLQRLEEYLNNCNGPVEVLCGFWKDQQDAITYRELREAVRSGEISQETIKLWQQDHSKLVAGRLRGVWTRAIKQGPSGQPLLDKLNLVFNTQTPGIMNWIKERGAEFVTNCMQEQKDAVAALLTKKMIDGHTVDELARLIRPCIGLTEGQAKANVRYYDSIVANLKKEHPRMKAESIKRKALDAAQKYAERQHRERAFTIARTESAFAYNRGADEGIRQAQEQNLLGEVKKRWSTSGDDAVCDICAPLEGMEIDMDDSFNYKGRLLFVGQKLLPPAHPRCACAIEYIETQAPAQIPQMKVSITETDSLKTYSDAEIQSIAQQTENVASNHISTSSKWSGKIIVDDESECSGKLWNCDILTTHETAPHILLHEQIHARSISYYNVETYAEFHNIEEASVQFMTQEISKKEGIEIIESQYDEMVDALRELGRHIGKFKNDYDFAKTLIEKPLKERLAWLEENVYGTMRIDATIEEYQHVCNLLDMLY